jgi:hypothetical protein
MAMPIMDGAATIRALSKINPYDQDHCGKRAARECGCNQGFRARASSTS